jgi:hypothetical protein
MLSALSNSENGLVAWLWKGTTQAGRANSGLDNARFSWRFRESPI